MIIYLYQVGRNLNRAVRTCEAFGVRDLRLIDCPTAHLAGNLYAAKGQVTISQSGWPAPLGLCALETWGRTPIVDLDWQEVTALLLGGESRGLPRDVRAQFTACIPQWGHISGLTVEAALAIALYEWRKHDAS